jgi:hypothetical protein
MYRAAAACGALHALDEIRRDNAVADGSTASTPPPLRAAPVVVVVYDACDLMRLAPSSLVTNDGSHFQHTAEPALADDLLQRVVCPAWAKQRGGERLVGTWSTAGMSYAEAKAAIDARFNCSAVRDSGKPVNKPAFLPTCV